MSNRSIELNASILPQINVSLRSDNSVIRRSSVPHQFNVQPSRSSTEPAVALPVQNPPDIDDILEAELVAANSKIN